MSTAIHETARSDAPAAALWRRLELPTWGVIVAVQGGFLALTWWHRVLPWWLLAALGALLVAWQASLQHEAVHGHPTRSARLNGWLAGPPFSLWLPFALYRRWHRAHHQSAELARPGVDPESFYVTAAEWRDAGPLKRCLLVAAQTLAGRLLLGPPWMVGLFWLDEVRRLARRDAGHLRIWVGHLAAVALLFVWLRWVGIAPWFYVAAMVWPGLSLTLLRSYHEHRPAAEAAERTASVRAAWPLALLYLNNNLHAAHHARPEVAWYELPRLHRRAATPAGYAVPGYASLFRRYLFRPKDRPVYPF